MENTDHSFYVYALKDGRKNPAQIFYIGKGTGTRKDDHLLNVDDTNKGIFIREIIQTGGEVIVSILVDNLTEVQALTLEAELISAFGTEKNGGILKNSVTPKSFIIPSKQPLNLPVGMYELATIGLKFIKKAMLEFLAANPDGIKNADFARYLNLHSDNAGKQKDYLTYSVLGILMRENKIKKEVNGKYKIRKLN
ncbi:GIY-YIG nuclease family protein [Candidatus Avelusimicrobium sp.]|uniref:GIY-YIG nuclease family protein n=1 Tax=Candidatus Avelusimicrobium sp. TaxID=3048833 RepID=UPI003D7EA4CE